MTRLDATSCSRILANGANGEGETLPALRQGESTTSGVEVRTTAVEADADQTKAPARISEARLLSLMENAGKWIEDESLAAVLHEKGLGTPATRADIIENLIAKGYAVRVGSPWKKKSMRSKRLSGLFQPPLKAARLL